MTNDPPRGKKAQNILHDLRQMREMTDWKIDEVELMALYFGMSKQDFVEWLVTEGEK